MNIKKSKIKHDSFQFTNENSELNSNTGRRTVVLGQGLYSRMINGNYDWNGHTDNTDPIEPIEKNQNEWSRDSRTKMEDKYYYLTRNGGEGFMLDNNRGSNARLMYTFPDIVTADKELFIHKLMMMMRSWARHYNEIDNFHPNIKNSDEKLYGLDITDGEISIDWYYSSLNFLFCIVVSSHQRAIQLRDEFQEELKTLIEIL